MISGAFVLTDTLGKSFDGIYNESYKATDAVISSKQAIKTTTAAPRRRRSRPPCSARSRACPACASRRARSRTSRGSSTRTARRSARRRWRRVRRRPSGDQSLNPLQLVEGAGPAATARSRSTGRPPPSSTSPSARPSARSATGPLAKYRVSGIVSFGSEGSIAGSTISVFDLATAQRLFDKRGKFDAIRVGAEDRRVGRRAGPPDPPAALRHDAGEDRGRAGRRRQQGDPGRAELLQVLPARLRRHRPVRGQLRDRQHARDHGRPADAGARDAAHARRLAPPGARLGRARVVASASSARSSASSWGSRSRWA